MFGRHDLSDADWGRVEPPIPGRAGGHGGVGEDGRRFVNAVRHLAESAIA